MESSDTESESEIPGPSAAANTRPASLNLNLNMETPLSYPVSTRRHHYPAYLPLLTLLRYMSTIYLAEVVNTSFRSPGLHHTCVSMTHKLC